MSTLSLVMKTTKLDFCGIIFKVPENTSLKYLNLNNIDLPLNRIPIKLNWKNTENSSYYSDMILL